MSRGEPFLFHDTLGEGIPVVSQLNTARTPAVTVTLNGPGLIEGLTKTEQDRYLFFICLFFFFGQ